MSTRSSCSRLIILVLLYEKNVVHAWYQTHIIIQGNSRSIARRRRCHHRHIEFQHNRHRNAPSRKALCFSKAQFVDSSRLYPSSSSKSSRLSTLLTLSTDVDASSSSSSLFKYTKKIRRSVAILLAVSFLPLLGFTMTSPLLPTLGQHFSMNLGSASFGLLTSAYPLGMFFGVFFWSYLSDIVGRKWTLLCSLLGSSIGLFLQSRTIALHGSMSSFLFMRVLTGVFAGSASIVKASLADLGSNTSFLPQLLAWRDAACTMAYIIGPLVGGGVFEALAASSTSTTPQTHALAFVIRMTAMATFIAACLIATTSLTESTRRKDGIQENNAVKESTHQNMAFHPSLPVQSCPVGSSLWSGIITVCIVSFLFHIADSTFFSFFPALLKTQLGFDARSIGMTFTTFATLSFAISASSVTSRLIQRWNVVTTCAMGLAMISLGLASLAMTSCGSSVWFDATTLGLRRIPPFLMNQDVSMWGILLSGMLYFCGVSLYSPCIPFMLLQCVPPHQRGRVMGLDGAINTIARVLSPLIMGEVYRQRGASMTFGLSSAAVCSSVLMILQSRRVV